MKIRFEYGGEIIEVNKVYIVTDKEEFIIKETKNAYQDDGKIEITKSSFDHSSTIVITPAVSNQIYLK